MSRPVNVLFLIRTWALGGSHTIVRMLMRHMPARGFNITTVVYDAPGSGNDEFIRYVGQQGLEVAPERIPWKSRSNWFPARSAIRGLVAKYDIDLIHAHDTHSNVLVGVGRGQYPCAAIASPYGWWDKPIHWHGRINHWVEKRLALPRFERVYTVSENMKAKVVAGGTAPERVRVIHTGIDLSQFETGASREDTRAQFGFKPDEVVIGTVSRLFKEKGHRHLIDALARLRAECPEARLMIVGTGDERPALEAQVRRLGLDGRVTFTGYHADLPGALRAMDIFAQPSVDQEGFPTAVLEAQAAGLPVVASDIGGTHETLDVGRTGLLTPPGDDKALAGALRDLIRDSQRRAAMAAAGRPWIESHFTLPGMMTRMTETYHEALGAYRDRR